MFNYKMANELEYAILSGVLFFIVGNPITYGIVGNFLKLNTKISKQHYILVFIHSIVMGLLMFVAMWLLDTYFVEAEEAVEAAVKDVVDTAPSPDAADADSDADSDDDSDADADSDADSDAGDADAPEGFSL